MKPFKFLQKERVFTDYLDQMDDYFLGNIQGELINAIHDFNNNRPPGLSNYQWNILPHRLRNRPERDILDYIDGWEAGRNNNLNNSHHTDLRRAELWNSGFWDCRDRMRTNNQVEELRVAFDNVFNNEPQVHGFTVGTQNTQLELRYEGGMDINSVRAMIHDLCGRYVNYVSINEQVIGFMEDYLNEHLNGSTRIRIV